MSVGLIAGALLLVFGADPLPKGWSIPLVDLNERKDLQILVDREKGQYLGHPTTVLLEDGKTILCVYPKGHGKGAIIHKKSTDGGLTWSERIPVPENWATSKETPTLHRLIDPEGKKRLVMFSGLHPVRMASSGDDGKTWTPLEKVGDYGFMMMVAISVKNPLPKSRSNSLSTRLRQPMGEKPGPHPELSNNPRRSTYANPARFGPRMGRPLLCFFGKTVG
jgi:hypothetical protein